MKQTDRFKIFCKAARRVDRNTVNGPVLLGLVAEECAMGMEEARNLLERAIIEKIAYRSGPYRQDEFYLEIRGRGD